MVETITETIEDRMARYLEVLLETGSVEAAELAVYGHLPTEPTRTYGDLNRG